MPQWKTLSFGDWVIISILRVCIKLVVNYIIVNGIEAGGIVNCHSRSPDNSGGFYR